MRLQKYIAYSGLCSRRKAEELILNKQIKVNGLIVDTLGTKINSETDIVEYNGKIININSKYIYLLLNKPVGIVTTMKDEYKRKTVWDLVKKINTRVYPVGRLDYDTSGLLIMTNDGDLTYKLTHPKHKIYKTYVVTLLKNPSESQINILRNGVIIDNYKTAPAKVKILNKSKNQIQISICEGKNRQIRKMFSSIGFSVIGLKRISIGKLRISNLEEGNYRELTKGEIQYLKSL